ncbi:hypothetical protein BJX66DRAFT_293213 [Aspergillus keveii]|uniref:Uncharacterized protein n=1 Tax=Aspergillus keveii TaxID=714993 RepID=A0ABR4GKL7_9EURO
MFATLFLLLSFYESMYQQGWLDGLESPGLDWTGLDCMHKHNTQYSLKVVGVRLGCAYYLTGILYRGSHTIK